MSRQGSGKEQTVNSHTGMRAGKCAARKLVICFSACIMKVIVMH